MTRGRVRRESRGMSGEKHSRQKEQPVQRPRGSRGASGTFKGQRRSRCDGRKGDGYLRSWGTGAENTKDGFNPPDFTRFCTQVLLRWPKFIPVCT